MKVSILTVAFFILLAIFSDQVVELVPLKRGEIFSPPSSDHLLGTNDVGEDVLKELIIATKVSVVISLFSATLSAILGLFIGIFSGYYRSLTAKIFETFTEVFLVIPTLPLLIVFSFHLPPSIFNIILLIALFSWPSMARIVRARVFQLRNSGFVQSAILFGASDFRIILHHIIPNLSEIFFARFSMLVAYSLIVESSLSFIGLADPTNKSWGAMLHYALKRGAILNDAWWCFVPPGVCIALLAVSFLLLSFEFEKVRLTEKFSINK
ncbi:MAG: ABC transporter permease [Archaeoglobaceae archaeon]|nr:ABC transporter permease [Archaeoglobaceae archaeon]MCX8152731.1 ABC transporter permease [Archaeoglobaceae archaeon]MDW8013438.1 ABC transporter permease [Archaeoglobaceae archaeon]